MKIYIYWQGTKNISDMNILEDETITEYSREYLVEISQVLSKPITKHTVMFMVPLPPKA